MIARSNEADPLIAYVYGETPPDLDAIAATGFDVVCLDSRAPWYRPSLITKAAQRGMLAVAHPMAVGG